MTNEQRKTVMFKPVNTIQLYDPYAVDLVNKVAEIEDRRPANCARFYLTQILTKRLKELSRNASKENIAFKQASSVDA